MRSDVEWALVADAQHLRILERRGRDSWVELPETLHPKANPASHLHGSERPGRVHESVGMARHAMEPRLDPHRAAEADFARHAAAMLEHAAETGRYGRLLIVAPPVFLGDLRKALGDETRRRLQGSLDKDLAQACLASIIRHVEALRPAMA
jgi:protein required for attachment to host cells